MFIMSNIKSFTPAMSQLLDKWCISFGEKLLTGWNGKWGIGGFGVGEILCCFFPGVLVEAACTEVGG